VGGVCASNALGEALFDALKGFLALAGVRSFIDLLFLFFALSVAAALLDSAFRLLARAVGRA